MADKEPEENLTSTTTDITIAVFVLLILLGIFGVYFDRILEWYQRFLEWFYSPRWDRFIQTVTIIFTVLNVLLITFMVATIRRFTKIVEAAPTGPPPEIHVVSPTEEVKENWEHIRELANSKNPSDWNMAIIRADALLDDILHHVGYQAETMAERLKIVDPTKLPSLDRVWSAHRLRNSIAHDPLEQHPRETIISALRSYEQALKELGMMKETKKEEISKETAV